LARILGSEVFETSTSSLLPGCSRPEEPARPISKSGNVAMMGAPPIHIDFQRCKHRRNNGSGNPIHAG
jgi:hypothetical protein